MEKLCFLEYADRCLLGFGRGRVGTVFKCVSVYLEIMPCSN